MMTLGTLMALSMIANAGITVVPREKGANVKERPSGLDELGYTRMIAPPQDADPHTLCCDCYDGKVEYYHVWQHSDLPFTFDENGDMHHIPMARSGKPMYEQRYDGAGFYHNGFAWVRQGTEFFQIDTEGTEVPETRFDVVPVIQSLATMALQFTI